MKTKNQEFYIEIEDSVELRRQMLETSKELIGILQQYEEIKNIENQKIQEIENFRSTLKEIAADIVRLKSLMPKVKLSELPRKAILVREPKHHAPEVKAAPEKQDAPEPEHPETVDSNKLESQLNEIEKKLQDLQ